jgi:hypothetical protein
MTSAVQLLGRHVGNVCGDMIEIDGRSFCVACGCAVGLLTYRDDHGQSVVLRKICGHKREEVTEE